MVHSCRSCRSQRFSQRKLPNLNGYSGTCYGAAVIAVAFLAIVDDAAGCEGNVCKVIDVLKAAGATEAAGAAATSQRLTELSCLGKRDINGTEIHCAQHLVGIGRTLK